MQGTLELTEKLELQQSHMIPTDYSELITTQKSSNYNFRTPSCRVLSPELQSTNTKSNGAQKQTLSIHQHKNQP
jgi:hypothetical protein